MADIFGKPSSVVKPQIVSRDDDSWKVKVWFGKDPSTSRVILPDGNDLKCVTRLSIEQDADTLQTLLHLTILEPVVLSQEPPLPEQPAPAQLQLNLESEDVQKTRLQQAMDKWIASKNEEKKEPAGTI